MSDHHGSSPLDALKINRTPSTNQSAGFPVGLVIGIVAIVLLIAGIGAGAYVFWPSAAIAVKAVTAEGDLGGGAGALDASGYVVARRKATISAKISGKLLSADLEEGDHVAKGQIVARLDDTNQQAALRESEARAAQARAAYENAKPTYDRYVTLRGQNAISSDALMGQKTLLDQTRTSLATAEANVATMKSNLADTIVRAPFAGVITDKVAQVGEIVAPGVGGGGSTRTGIATIVDMDSLEVEVDVSENYIERVRPGQKAMVTLNAYPQWTIPASVTAIIPTADQAKASVKVRVGMQVKDARILPQMGAHVSFLTDDKAPIAAAPRGLSVPAEAVRISGKTGTVFVIQDDKVEQRQVTLGVSNSQTATILSGIQSGDRLAVGDFAKLKDGMKVTVQE